MLSDRDIKKYLVFGRMPLQRCISRFEIQGWGRYQVCGDVLSGVGCPTTSLGSSGATFSWPVVALGGLRIGGRVWPRTHGRQYRRGWASFVDGCIVPVQRHYGRRICRGAFFLFPILPFHTVGLRTDAATSDGGKPCARPMYGWMAPDTKNKDSLVLGVPCVLLLSGCI